MKKNLGVVPAVFPMPVAIISAYDENGKPNSMNAAWAMVNAMDKITLFINRDHKTTKNIVQTKAFTVAFATVDTMDVADYVGIASGNTVADKFEKTGYHQVKGEHVNAPVITEFPVTMECELLELADTENLHAVVGKIVNVVADEKVLTADGKVDPSKLNAIVFDPFQSGYYAIGEKVGQAWSNGKKLM